MSLTRVTTNTMNLSESLLIEICTKSLENARDLISDADLLKANQRIPRAYTLYQFATEELGKASYCHSIIHEEQYDDPNVIKEFIKFFFSHQKKTVESLSLNFLIAQVNYKGDSKGAYRFLQLDEEKRKQVQATDDLKNYSLYTSIIDLQVKNPAEMISRELLSEIELEAKSRFNLINTFVLIGIKHLPEIREFQRANPNYKPDIEAYIKEHWGDEIEKPKSS